MIRKRHRIGYGRLIRRTWWTGPWPAPYDRVRPVGGNKIILAYQPKWAVDSIYKRRDEPSYINSKINLAHPGRYNATEGSQPSWTAEQGWNFDFPPFSNYLDTTAIPKTSYGMAVQLKASLAFGSYGNEIAGVRETAAGNTRFYLGVNVGGVNRVSYGHGSFSNVAPQISNAEGGNIAIYNAVGYRNGVAEATVTPSYDEGTVFTSSLYIGGLNRTYSTVINGLGLVEAFVLFKDITVSQLQAISWAMNVIGAI